MPPADNAVATSGHELSVTLAYKPSFGRNIDYQTGDSMIDDGALEGTADVKFTLSPVWSLTTTLGVTSNPEIFDDDAPTSALYGTVKLAGKLPLTREWELAPSVSIQRSAAYSDYLEGWKYTDLAIDAGTAFNFYSGGKGKTGKRWEATLELKFQSVDSGQADRDRLGFQAAASATHWFSDRFGAYGKATFSGQYFTDKPVTGDPQWEDYILVQEGGVVVKNMFDFLDKDYSTPELRIAVSMRRRWSNNDARDYDRVFFAPAIKLTQKFK